MYLTTRCNLKCDYCYEGEGRENLIEQRDLMKEDIEIFLDEIAVREKGQVSTLVIMGGEPFLKFDLLKYAVDTAWKMDHKFGISITTNGTLINAKFSKAPSLIELKELVSKISTLEISWDGSGHDRRVYGHEVPVSSRPMVHKAILMLADNNIPFRISYTVHKNNWNKLVYDMVYIMEKFKPAEIKLSFACQELEDNGVDFKMLKEKLLEYAEHLYISYGIPICDLSCKLCGKCKKSNFIGNSYMSPTTGISYEEIHSEKKFTAF